MVAAACLRRVVGGELFAGIMIHSKEGLFRERINTGEKGKYPWMVGLDGKLSCSE